MCDSMRIKFIGIHYTEAEKFAIPQFDSIKEKYRFDILEKELIWLSPKALEEKFKTPNH